MPKLAPTRPDDLAMGPIHGTVGKSRPCGLYLHRYQLDVSTVNIQGTDDFAIFEPAFPVRPVMIVYCSFTWDLGDVNLDNAEISIGGNAAADDLVQATPIDLGSNGEIRGNTLDDHSSLSLLIRTQGSTSHSHWAKPLTGYAGGDPVVDLPVLLRVNASPASASPYSGTITAHILWTPLRAF